MRTVLVDSRGLSGDRWYAVEDGEGHFASGKNTRRFRRRDAVFGYAAATTAGNEVEVTGNGGAWKAGAPALDEELSRAMGTPVAVVPERDVPHQDMGAVSLVSTATLEWCANMWSVNADPRRLRVNIVFAAEQPFVEEQWQGKLLAVGQVRLRVAERAPRCRMIDIAQDGVRPDGRWLKPLATERDMFLAMYADVDAAGFISVGDRLSVE